MKFDWKLKDILMVGIAGVLFHFFIWEWYMWERPCVRR